MAGILVAELISTRQIESGRATVLAIIGAHELTVEIMDNVKGSRDNDEDATNLITKTCGRVKFNGVN
jgi:hypothetical protein